jgi:hypothetical protein
MAMQICQGGLLGGGRKHSRKQAVQVHFGWEGGKGRKGTSFIRSHGYIYHIIPVNVAKAGGGGEEEGDQRHFLLGVE